MADAIKNAAQAAKDAVANVTEAVANTSIAGGAAGQKQEGTTEKLMKDEETGEMVSKSECTFVLA